MSTVTAANLNAADALNAQRVAAVRRLRDGTVDGRKNLALGRVDTAAFAQNALRKHLVGDLFHRNNGAFGVSRQRHRERGGCRSRFRRLFQKVKKSHGVQLSFYQTRGAGA